jgi:hypothetical protein
LFGSWQLRPCESACSPTQNGCEDHALAAAVIGKWAGQGAAGPPFLAGGGIDPAEPRLSERVHALQVLRMMEQLASLPD